MTHEELVSSLGLTRGKKNIIVVCMFDSIHAYRWLNQFRHEDLVFHLVPSSPHRRLHPGMVELLREQGTARYLAPYLGRLLGLPLWLLDKVFDNRLRGFLLRALVKRVRPVAVHTLEMQNAGYIALRAFQKKPRPDSRLFVTNWGSDIFWFQRFESHRRRIANLLSIADIYSAECARDIELARSLGFVGTVKEVIPNAGGIPDHVLESPLLPPNDREIILVKGYHGWVGRAILALKALEALHHEIQPFSVVVYSANLKTYLEAKRIAWRTGLTITVFRKNRLTHSELISLFKRSRVYIGLSLSDGISTSFLEALASGAIPVQTDTACIDEWTPSWVAKVEELTLTSVRTAVLDALEKASNFGYLEANRDLVARKGAASKVSLVSRTFYDNL